MKKNILIAIILIIMGVWWAYMTKGTTTVSNGNATNTPSQIVTTATSAPIDFLGMQVNTTGWKTYKSLTDGFSFKYPNDWTVEEFTIDITNKNTNNRDKNYQERVTVYNKKSQTYNGILEFAIIYCCRKNVTINDLEKEINPENKLSVYKIPLENSTIVIFGPKGAKEFDLTDQYIVGQDKIYYIFTSNIGMDFSRMNKIVLGLSKSFKLGTIK